MSEKAFCMTPYGVEYFCDKCGTGLMEPYGKVVWDVHPPLFPHKCSNCGDVQGFTERYPTVRWRRGDPLPTPEGAPK
jgi:hypothetical protein